MVLVVVADRDIKILHFIPLSKKPTYVLSVLRNREVLVEYLLHSHCPPHG